MSDAGEIRSRRTWLAAAGLSLAGLAAGRRVPAVASVADDSKTGSALARLSLNENPFGCSPRVHDAIRAHLRDLNRYTGAEAEELTARIAAREGARAGQILLGDILQRLGTQLSLEGGPGGEFIYSTPGFTELVDAAEAAGGRGVAVPLNGALENDLSAMAARVSDRTRAVFLVNPHNPSGTVSEASALHAFVRDVSRRALVIVDEAYLEFTPDFERRTIAARVLAGDNAIVFRTFAKIYGLAGMPLGYGIMPAQLAEQLRRSGAGDPHELDRLAVLAASVALTDHDFVAATRRRVTAERTRWHTELRRAGRRFADARANFVFFETGRPHAQVAARFRARGVDIGRDFPPLDRWARVSIGLPEENTLALAALSDVIGGRPG